MANGLANFAMRMMMQNPNVRNSPIGREFMDILQSGDQARGEQLASNLCQSYGTSKEDALNQARNFFHI